MKAISLLGNKAKQGEKAKAKSGKSNMIMILSALAIIWLIFTLITGGNYISARNISNLFRQTSITAILAVGMMFVIISGEIDLSVGSQMALLGGVAAILNVWFGINTPVTIILTLIAGVALGAFNGFWIAYKKVPSFIVTLAGLLAFRGILIGITKGTTVAPVSEGFKLIGQGYIPNSVGYILSVLLIMLLSFIIINERNSKLKHGIEVEPMNKVFMRIALLSLVTLVFVQILNSYAGIPVPVFIMLAVLGIFSYIAKKTVFGRTVYSIGGNIDAAKYSGVNTKKVMFIIFLINGLLVGAGGIILSSRLGAGSVSAGTNAELDAIASCVIGGASLAGGIGTIVGALVGALVMASLDNGMSMMSVAPSWQYVVKGSILLFAVYLDVRSKNKK